MLGFLKPRGDLVESDGNHIVFLTSKPLKIDQRTAVRMSVSGTVKTWDLPIKVVGLRGIPDGRWLIVAVSEYKRPLPAMRGLEVRRHPRVPCRVTLKSQSLPGFRAVTRNVSKGGFYAELDGELELGEALFINFEFDDPIGYTLDLKAQVQWIEWKSGNRYDTGFAFFEDPEYAEALGALDDWLEHQQNSEGRTPFKPGSKVPRKKHAGAPEIAQPAKPGGPTPIRPAGSIFKNSPTSSSGPASASAPGAPQAHVVENKPPVPIPKKLAAPIAIKLNPSVPLERPSALELSPAKQAASAETVSMKGPDGPPAVDDKELGIKIPFQARLRGWAWEQADDAVVVVLEDSEGVDHWVEFPHCRGMQARCREREINLQGIAVAHESALITELSRESDDEEALMHFRFYDDHQRVFLDLVAGGCRQQER